MGNFIGTQCPKDQKIKQMAETKVGNMFPDNNEFTTAGPPVAALNEQTQQDTNRQNYMTGGGCVNYSSAEREMIDMIKQNGGYIASKEEDGISTNSELQRMIQAVGGNDITAQYGGNCGSSSQYTGFENLITTSMQYGGDYDNTSQYTGFENLMTPNMASGMQYGGACTSSTSDSDTLDGGSGAMYNDILPFDSSSNGYSQAHAASRY